VKTASRDIVLILGGPEPVSFGTDSEKRLDGRYLTGMRAAGQLSEENAAIACAQRRRASTMMGRH